MIVRIASIFFGFLCTTTAYGQRAKPFLCGHYPKDLNELINSYEHSFQYLGVKSGERVASVGASSGYNEMNISCFVEDINWTIQDIDSVCLNENEFRKVKRYYEGLIEKPIKGKFDIVLGEPDKTNLPRNLYDRLLMISVYHELSERNRFLLDIHGSLKANGLVVIMDITATKKGQLHSDCNLPKLWEPDLITEMKGAGFELIDRTIPFKKLPIAIYTFRKV